MQEFTNFSDYYGRDIFEAAKPITMVRLAMYWTHRGMDALSSLEKTRLLPVEAYGNVLKAGWIIQRILNDKRPREDECAAVVISLSEVGSQFHVPILLQYHFQDAEVIFHIGHYFGAEKDQRAQISITDR